MKILLDMNLPPVLGEFLIKQGYEAVHWSSIGDVAAPDKVIFEYARDNGYIIFTHDLDFSALLAAAQAHAPSVFQIRTQDVLSDNFKQAIIGALRQFEALFLHSKRANIYYLQHCRILVKGGWVEYITEEGKSSLYWNIPIANTTCLLLGTGTSITQAAMRELAKAGVMVGFSGGGGTPLFSAQEVDVEVVWISPQSEYRPTGYLQHWVRFWFDDALRLEAAKRFQLTRLKRLEQHWFKSRALSEAGFHFSTNQLQPLLERSASAVENAPSINDLLTFEARLTKNLYKIAVHAVGAPFQIHSSHGTPSPNFPFTKSTNTLTLSGR